SPGSPCSSRRSASSAMCASISAAKSSTVRLRRNTARLLALLRSHDSPDRRDEPLPSGRLPGELPAARRGPPVEAGLAVVRGGPPLRKEPAALLEPLERRIERAVLDEELLLGPLLDGAGDPLTVLRAEDQGPQDQQVERPLQQLQAVGALPV